MSVRTSSGATASQSFDATDVSFPLVASAESAVAVGLSVAAAGALSTAPSVAELASVGVPLIAVEVVAVGAEALVTVPAGGTMPGVGFDDVRELGEVPGPAHATNITIHNNASAIRAKVIIISIPPFPLHSHGVYGSGRAKI